MIITCPQCDTRFVVPSTIFDKGGRKVRCANCKHEWFHEQNPDKKGAAFSSMVNEAGNTSDGKNGFAKTLRNDFVKGGRIVAASCFTVLFVFFLVSFINQEIIYGEGLAFNDLQIERDDEVIVITGEIVNTANNERGVPPLKVTYVLNEDILGDSHILTMEQATLASGEVMPLSITLDDVTAEVEDITITFAGAIKSE